MADQFEAEKCLHAGSTDNLVLMIIDNRSDPRATPPPQAIQMVQIPGPGLKVGAKPRGLPGCWRLELTDAYVAQTSCKLSKKEKEARPNAPCINNVHSW